MQEMNRMMKNANITQDLDSIDDMRHGTVLGKSPLIGTDGISKKFSKNQKQ